MPPRRALPAIFSDDVSQIIDLVSTGISTVDDDQFTLLLAHTGASRDDVASMRQQLT